MMHHFTLADIQGEIIAVIALGGGIAIAVISIITNACKSAVVTGQRERSRREIAAYIAEGSMSPDEGERLLNAGAIRDKMKA